VDLIVIGALAVLLVLTNAYFMYVRPQRRREALLAAVPLLESESRQDLAAAESLLVQALSAGLGRRDTSDARFALAWTRAKLGRFDPAKYGEALSILGGSRQPGDASPASADLRLWLLAQLGRHDEILAAMRNDEELRRRQRNRLIFAAAWEHRAVDLWNRGDADGAVLALRKAHRPGIDPQLRARELVELLLENAMRAIHDEEFKAAMESLAQAEKMAVADSVQQVEAKLGQLVCRWRQGDGAKVLAELPERLEALRNRAELRGASQDDVRLLRAHVGWWYLAGMLGDWLRRLPAGEGLPMSERERFLRVLRIVEEADPDLGVVVMMHGVIEYGLAADAGGRASAAAILARSTRLAAGVTLPEVLRLIDDAIQRTEQPSTPDWPDSLPDPEPEPDEKFPRPEEAPMSMDELLAIAVARASQDPGLARTLADLELIVQTIKSRTSRLGEGSQ
jgi:hypothetical protein